jgi:pimeloyl-ACP methyl ester carboxylesterase
VNPTYVPGNAIYDTGKFVTVDGARMHYVERGDGPLVVLVHGLADDARTWNAAIEALSGNYRVIAPDLIGHGRSDKPPLNYRAGTFAHFLSKLLDELRIERATFVGNSLGGWASLLVALSEPHRVERLILVDSAGYADQKLPAVLNPTTLEESRELLHYVFAS